MSYYAGRIVYISAYFTIDSFYQLTPFPIDKLTHLHIEKLSQFVLDIVLVHKVS